MITLTIDDQKIQAGEEQTILEVARREGIPIPTLCYHPAVEPYGACRMCTVEVEHHGRSRLETACTMPVREGMVVRTATPDVYKARQTLMGLFLSRCPNVPLIQDLAAEYGVTEPPYPTDRPEEKCILCGLCVRVCHEVVGAKVLNFSSRGISRQVGPPFLEETRECIGCGACTLVCPTGAIEVALEREAVYQDMPLGPISAIYVPALQAVPRVPVIDTDACIRFRQNDRTDGQIADACGVCQMMCEAGAVDFDQQDEIIELDVGAIILATGYDLYDPEQMPEYGYGLDPDVITALQFERMTSTSGPTRGEVVTSDGRVPKAIALLHCIGSRDENHLPHCSRVCCMYALKQAHMARDKTGAEVYQFYIDIRSAGKSYEEFYKRIQEEGVHQIRGKVSSVHRKDGRLVVRAEDTLLGRLVEVPVDLVVLMNGWQSAEGTRDVAQMFHVSLSPDGFFLEAHPKLKPVETNTGGIFLAGACQSPKDIPDTVAQASGAAIQAVKLLAKGVVDIEPTVAHVITERCTGCGECTVVCPYQAIALVEGKAEVNAALCTGCGTCVAACVSKALVAEHFTDEQLVAQVVGVLAQEEPVYV